MSRYDDGIEVLKGKTIEAIHGDQGSDELVFDTSDGESYKMYHSQDCCESVSIEEIIGDLKDLIGNPILLAEEVSSSDPDEALKLKREQEEAEKDGGYYYGADSETWTFYKLSTIKGSVTIRWYGTSNGYYSEGVSFVRL